MSYEIERIKKILPITNELSSTFCLAKWHHVTIYLQTGETHSCYHPAPHKIPLEEVKSNPSALHNTSHKKQERLQMLNGEKPVGCTYCWNVEALGDDYVSDRHIRTASIYTEERFKEIKNNPWNFDINPEYIELSFGNECNFKCGYCHPKASSRYYREIQQFGPYDMVNNHRQDIDWFETYPEDNNPYVDAWWKWWPDVRKTLNILRLTGGEPLMHKSTWRLLDSMKQDPLPHLELNINSNLGVKTEWVQRLSDNVVELLNTNSIRKFKLFSSIDTWNKRAEYIRTGLDLELWEKNLDTYVRTTRSHVTFMITFNILTVTTFTSLLEKILEWRKLYNDIIPDDEERPLERKIRFDTPHLKEPLQYDMNILPKEEFMPYMYAHLKFIEDNCDENDVTKFSQLEYERFKRVVKYMESSIYPEHKLAEGRKDFYNWFTEFDRRRGTNFLETFPEYETFYLSGKDEKATSRTLPVIRF
jgi:organic radical activating enzyme